MSVWGSTLRWASRSLPVVLGVILVAVGVALDPHVGLLFVASFLFAWWLVPRTAVLARHLGAIAKPGGRGIHRRTTPLLGGARSSFRSQGACSPTRSAATSVALGLLLGATLVFWLGIVDDIQGVGPAKDPRAAGGRRRASCSWAFASRS